MTTIEVLDPAGQIQKPPRCSATRWGSLRGPPAGDPGQFETELSAAGDAGRREAAR